MLAVVDMIRRENQMYIDMGRKEGKIEGKIEIAKKLLKMGISVEKIIEATSLTKEEIEKIKY